MAPTVYSHPSYNAIDHANDITFIRIGAKVFDLVSKIHVYDVKVDDYSMKSNLVKVCSWGLLSANESSKL